MTRILITFILASFTWLAAPAAFAQTPSAADVAEVKEVTARLQKLYPSTTFKSVTATPVPGIFQVVMGRNVVHVDASGRFFLMGHMVDMPLQKDLTADAAEAAKRVDVKTLPLGDAIKIVKGDGTRVLYLWSDPDCPFCKQLEETLAAVSNVTVYVYLMPLDGIHPDATRKAKAIWCSTDRAAAWTDLMLHGKSPTASPNCDTPIERNLALGKSIGATGTPTMLNALGDVNVGRLPLDRLERFLGSTVVGKVISSTSGVKQ